MFAINKLRLKQSKQLGSKLAVGDSAVCRSSVEGAFTTQEGRVDAADANLLVQIGAAGIDEPNNGQYKQQVIESNGKEILNETVGRAVRATKLRFEDDAWTLVQSDVQDTYGDTTQGTKLNSFLESFANEELLVLSTWDEPSKNAAFKDTLKNQFGATQVDGWVYRSAYAIVAKKDTVNNNGLVQEEQLDGVIEFTTALACDGTNAPDWVAQCYQSRTTFLTDDNLPNCLVTADFGATKECYKCEAGQTYDEQYQCITLADAETQGVCTSVTGVPAGTDECSQCDAGKGSACAEGTVLVSDGTCVPAILHCHNQDCDGKCLECLNGQYLAQDKNVCVASIDHCVDQESSGECLNCQAGYVEVADDKCCAEINNCKVYNAATCGVCDQVCEIGETEQNDICHVIIDQCDNYNDDSTCDYCENGYQVAADNAKKCVPNAPHCHDIYEDLDCATCDAGYTLVSEPALGHDKCVTVIDHCADYDQATEHCHGCDAAQELAYDDDVCVPQIPDCKVYEADGDCYECDAGYLGLSPDSCHEDIEYCTKQGCSGACEACAYGQVVLGGACSPAIAQCADYSSTGDCATCSSGYHSHDHECHEDKHCHSYNCEGTCVKCADGYTLTEQGVCTDTA